MLDVWQQLPIIPRVQDHEYIDAVELADALIRTLEMSGERGTIEIQVDRGQAVKVRKHTEYGRNALTNYRRVILRAGDDSPVVNQ